MAVDAAVRIGVLDPDVLDPDAVDGGKTDVVLVHRDFPRHGEGWEKYKTEMAAKSGWPRLMDLYKAAVDKGA